MTKRLYFAIFCIEEYKLAKGMSGDEVVALFNKYSIIQYLERYYDALHTKGIKYLINDIDEQIEVSKSIKKHRKMS